MPQLNPSPWLLVLLMLWLTINTMLVVAGKIYQMKLPTTTETNHKTHQMAAWTWPW